MRKGRASVAKAAKVARASRGAAIHVGTSRADMAVTPAGAVGAKAGGGLAAAKAANGRAAIRLSSIRGRSR